METATGLTVYTSEELQGQITATESRVKNNTIRAFARTTLEVFREEISNGDLDKDYATELHNKLADRIGFDNVESVSQTYSVSVTYNGHEIATFTGIEADDEDEACDKVSENLEVDEAEISISLTYNGESVSETASVDGYTILNDLELTASIEY